MPSRDLHTEPSLDNIKPNYVEKWITQETQYSKSEGYHNCTLKKITGSSVEELNLFPLLITEAKTYGTPIKICESNNLLTWNSC